MMEKKDPNVLEYLMKHPVAPLLGGVMLLGSQFVEEPAPPQLTDDLPEQTAKQWQMVYAQNLQPSGAAVTIELPVGQAPTKSRIQESFKSV